MTKKIIILSAITALRRRIPARALSLLFVVAAGLALGAAALVHERAAREAHARLEGEGVAIYRGLSAAVSPTAATQEFEAAARQALIGTRVLGLGIYHAGLAPLARAGTVPETLSPEDAAVLVGRVVRRREGDTHVVLFPAQLNAEAPLVVLLRMDGRWAAAKVVADAWWLYGGATLVALLCALGGCAALWRSHLEPAERLSQLAAGLNNETVAPAFQSRGDALGDVARQLDSARRARAAIAVDRAQTEERIEATLRQRARQLYEAKERAEAANRAKSAFLATMSHELRTPLNAVIGFSGMIHQQMLGPIGSPRYIEYAGDINRSATHLLGIVNDILDLSKIESDAVDLHEETFALAPLAEECASMLRDRIRAKNIAFAVTMAPVMPALHADRRRIKQILINLLSNAEKFTDPGGRIGLYMTTSPDGGAQFVVTDSGIGMTPAEIAIALKPFGQVDSRLARKYEGTGLGLPVTKSMVEMHQGRMVIDSAPGRGTTVTVTLPAARVVPAPAPAAAAHA